MQLIGPFQPYSKAHTCTGSMTAPPVDLVSSLQEAIGRLNAMLFNYLGALQRDAPPQPVKEEALVAAPKTYDVLVSGAAGSGRTQPAPLAPRACRAGIAHPCLLLLHQHHRHKQSLWQATSWRG